MKARQRKETRGKRRARVKKEVSLAETSMRDNDTSEVIVLDTSSSEAPTPNIVSLLDSTDDSTNDVMDNSNAQSKMKQICIKLQDLANVPGALSSKQLDYLAARRRKAKERAVKNEKRRNQRKPKKKEIKVELITKAISISSDSIEGGVPILDRKATPKRPKKESQKSKKKGRRGTEEKVVEIVTPLAFGEKDPSETSAWRIDDKNNFNEKVISICGSSNESSVRVSTTTTTVAKKAAKKRKRCDSELETHSFTAELEASSRQQRNRNSKKRKKSEPRRKQGVGQRIVNGKSGLSEESSVDRVDSSKASRNDAAQGDKLTDAVDDSAGTASIAPVNENISTEKASIVPVNANINTEKASIVPANANINTEKASIVPVNESIESGRASTASVNESIKSEKSGIVPVNESIESGRASNASVNESIKSQKSGIVPVNKSIESGRASNASVNESIKSKKSGIVPVNESIESGRASNASVNESIKSGRASNASVNKSIESGRASNASVNESIKNEKSGIVPVNESIESGRASNASINESTKNEKSGIVPVNESIESGRASNASVNESIASAKESIAAGKASIVPEKEGIAADRSIANNDFAVNQANKTSAINVEGKTSAINDEGKTSAINDEGKTSAVNDEGKSFDQAPMVNGDLTNEDFSSLQPFLDCDTDIKMIRLETNGNEELTLFSASGNDADHALDKESCSLASIVEAINNDLAGGNQPIGLPIGGIDSAEMMSLLPDPSMSSNEVNQSGDVEPRLNASARSNESFVAPPANGELAPSLCNGNGSIELNAKRKLPAIIEDNIFAQGTIELNFQKIRENRRRKKLSQTAISTPASSVDDNRNFADSIEITLTRDEKLSDSINEWGIDVLLDEKCDNNDSPAAAKGGQICEDALNNNRETTVRNKNEINPEKQEIIINDCSAKPVTSQSEGSSCKEYNALKSLVDMAPEALAKAIADAEAGSDLSSFDEPRIDDALAQFENSIVINNSQSSILRDALIGEARPVGPLTVQNLNKFNSRVGLVETESKPTSLRRRETVDTDGSSQRTDNTTDSTRTRKRKWILPNEEKPASPSSKNCTIKLNRRTWPGGSQKSREKCRDVEQPRGLEPEAPVAKVAKIEGKKNCTEIPTITETVSMINEITRQLLSPIKNAQGCVNEIAMLVPDFGGSSLCNLATSTPTKNDVAPVVVSGNEKSSGSSSSSSSSDSGSSSSSSSSSSDQDSSDESDDEDISSNVENVEGAEVVFTKNNEAPCKSDSGTKSSTKTIRQTVEEKTLALFGAEPEPPAPEIPAGGLVDDCDDPEKSDDDKSDCISLYTESLCMSRPGSPERQVSLRCSALAVSPQKQQKRGNVRSRLGPRVQTQPNAATAATKSLKRTERGPPTAASNIVEPATNDEVAVEPAPSKVGDRLVAPNVIQICPEAAAPVVPDPTAISRMEQRQIEIHFRGQCFGWLKQGFCTNTQCRFQHIMLPQLQYQLFRTPNTRAIILYSIGKQYIYFINVVFQPLMSTMTVRQIIQFVIDLCTSRILTIQHFVTMIEALKVHQLTLVQVVGLFDSMMSKSDAQSAIPIIESFCTLLEPGSYWTTLKKLMTKFSEANLSIVAVTAVLDECVKLRRNKLHVDDVHDNLVVKLTNEMRLSIGGDLLKAFYDLRYANAADENNDPPVEAAKKSNWTCSIASPDSVRESVDFPLAAQLADRPSSSSPTPATQPQVARETSKPSSVSQSDEASTSGCESYTLKHLDKLAPPKSAYNLWKFHLDLQGVQQGLLNNDYDHVIKILTALQEDPNRLPHIAGFYNILCKEIMSSRHHLEEIVRRTVQSGATDELRRFVYDLGVCVLTTLADTGAWVLAYQLLKTFKVYGQYNTCAFTLLSSEIYIANHRPLKALAILKQSQLVFTNPRRWNQMWCPNDEPLRVSVMELLLSSLCDGYAEHALSLLDFILGDQCNSVKPINIGRYIDRVAAVLLREDLTNGVVDLGRLIIENNLLVSSRTFRALINRIIHSEPFLAKQLHRYATWLGTYNTPKISGITHMIVNIDWTEEEMYLMFSSLLHDLYLNIGHAIDRLRPRQLSVYLILEKLPTERHLLMDVSGPSLTNAEIKKRRAVVKSVFERFDPKIKIIQRLQGKLCKIQSESLVNYLKAGHFKC